MALESGLLPLEVETSSQFFCDLEQKHYFEILEKDIGQITWKTIEPVQQKGTNLDWLDEILFNGNPHLSDQAVSIHPGDIIELVGPSGSGKSSIMYELIVNTLLPAYWSPESQQEDALSSNRNIALGGNGKDVIFFDCDMRIHIGRINDILVQSISQKLSTCNFSLPEFDSRIRQLAKACLRKLFIFRPSSPSQLLNTIAGLPIMNDSDIGLILIDSLTQFYWAAKCGIIHLAKNQYYTFQQDLAHVLKKLLVSQKTFAIVSSWPPFPKKNPSKPITDDFLIEQSEVRDSLNSIAWIHAVNYRLVIKQLTNSSVEITRPYPLSQSGTSHCFFRLDYYGLTKL
ncbi:hypothetical protein DSO57_1013236 [Entomophthora muscae]|nr:hypothetical protein DSO57_1013236 [Entomophthora muscae]